MFITYVELNYDLLLLLYIFIWFSINTVFFYNSTVSNVISCIKLDTNILN